MVLGGRPAYPGTVSSSLRPVLFRYQGDAHRVALVGSFNHWSPHAHPLHRTGDAWEVTVFLPPGSYPYAFDVDGKLVRDPDPERTPEGAPGARYSVVVVPAPSRPVRAA